MQVAVAVGCSHADTFCLNGHRGTGGLLLEVVASLDLVLLGFQGFLAAVHLGQF